MAKKKAATKKAAPAKKAASKKAPAKKAPAPVEKSIEIDATVAKALDLVQASEAFGDELEDAVGKAMTLAVRKVYREHKIVLSAVQATQVAMVLFSDEECDCDCEC